MIDNNDELRNIVLSVLSKLTIIHTHDFGVRCFNLLRDLMVSEKELEDIVRQQVNTNIIQRLNKLPPKDIPIGLLNGLTSLLRDPLLQEQNLMT